VTASPPDVATGPSKSSSDPGIVPAGRFSCVVDEDPRFHLEALRWFGCLTEAAGVDPHDLVVHVVGGASSDALEFVQAKGTALHPIDRFDQRSPHCNKISGALRLSEDHPEGLVALCDTDIAVLEDPRRLAVPPGSIAGKTVDAPLPPLDVIVRIFDAAGVAVPSTVALPWGPDQWTVSGNNNGGLYLVPGPLLPRVAEAWATWASWLLDRAELLEEWSIYVDQVAMALGLASEAIGSHPLEVRWNTPTHDLTRIPTDPPVPAVLHYHQEVDRMGRLRPVGRRAIDERVAVANEAIDRVWSAAAPYETYQRWLAARDPATTPQPAREQQRAMIGRIIAMLEPDSVLEVGCGEGDVTQNLPLGRYTGVDISSEAVRRARLTHPDGEFVVGSLDRPIEADLVVGLDVLTELTAASDYRRTAELLWESTRQALVVSGYEAPPGELDPRATFHEPLSDTLRRVAPHAEAYPVVAEGPMTTFTVLRAVAGAHPRDYPATTLAPLVARHPDPAALMEMRVHARRTVGFYPDHSPRLWEYPVVAKLVEEHLPPGSRLLDIGAGVSPLSPFLTSRGYEVDTLDPSPVRRDWKDHQEWNEWHYLDYGAAGLARQSYNCTLDELPRTPSYDGVFSISVIEHMPAVTRRMLLDDISLRTRLGGLVVLTIDLLPGTDNLWNMNLGVEVDDPAVHGTFPEVIDECTRVGLEVFHQEDVRDWPETHVEIGLLIARKVRPSTSNQLQAGRGLRTLARRLRQRL
jgi:2-polyprenyl-3-methyl-5-hydroxy-6-metoxy-1,4-benzoquinol methylase